MYVVTAATGQIGRALVEELLKKGQKVRAVARNAEKLRSLKDRGAEVVAADVRDAGDMIPAFSGAKAVFLLIPPNYAAPDFRAYQNRVSEAYAAAIRAAGIKYVVNLSSVGAHRPERVGPI